MNTFGLLWIVIYFIILLYVIKWSAGIAYKKKVSVGEAFIQWLAIIVIQIVLGVIILVALNAVSVVF